ncbi:MAG: low molecular weight phosphotyrosine protein phosphatase [Dechloromonas sp.]|jgi:protein-tyrosine phosphatase|uniref:protein-tyrosine-phosphatase n=1 Tax=Azonexus hydrophilus TaxID=418702 RepID=A0ABZ2XG11_9RHOO|nr:low molecular weight protein-tyrosine-phosphatase [Azonexus hydrophilus]MBS4019189.1 low molecular weight phosphotyrosine protein phosphatase [Dechloromonas sp.]MCA1937054.1 low molecular weight phosphotyrosine protein phosphatase [Dechloromonas sp.]
MIYRVLLVCMGNICRSPTAEVVLRHMIKINGLGDRVEVDSAGTHGYHVGEAPDSRTQRAASARGYNLSQLRARKVALQDLDYFDLILAMDRSNLDNLQRMAMPEQLPKIQLLMDYAGNFEDDEVPDPYYGLGHGFDLVLDMVEDAAKGVVEAVQKKLSSG